MCTFIFSSFSYLTPLGQQKNRARSGLCNRNPPALRGGYIAQGRRDAALRGTTLPGSPRAPVFSLPLSRDLAARWARTARASCPRDDMAAVRVAVSRAQRHRRQSAVAAAPGGAGAARRRAGGCRAPSRLLTKREAAVSSCGNAAFTPTPPPGEACTAARRAEGTRSLIRLALWGAKAGPVGLICSDSSAAEPRGLLNAAVGSAQRSHQRSGRAESRGRASLPKRGRQGALLPFVTSPCLQLYVRGGPRGPGSG